MKAHVVESSFEFDGVIYESRILQVRENQTTYFEVDYHPADQPQKSKMVFMENNEVGNWVQKKLHDDEAEYSNGFIEAIGKEISLSAAGYQQSTV